MTLLNSLAVVKTLPCLADPGKIIVVGEADAALDGVLPLLNAMLPNVVSYNPFAGVMTLRRRPGLITIYPRRVMITQVGGVEEGLALLAAMRDLLNLTWARREETNPDPKGAQRVSARRLRAAAQQLPRGARPPAWRLSSACWRRAASRRSALPWPAPTAPGSAPRSTPCLSTSAATAPSCSRIRSSWRLALDRLRCPVAGRTPTRTP
jgi:hypothetical protein